MTKIKFANNSWTATIADDFTTDNIARVAKASAVWLLNKTREASVVIGYDARFGGKLFAETTAKVFALTGVKVYITTCMSSASMISLGIIKKNASLGIYISANNEHPKYNGYQIFGDNGASLAMKELRLIENLVPPINEIDLTLLNWDEFTNQGLIEYYDVCPIYADHLENYFNMAACKEIGNKIIIDISFSCGQKVLLKLFKGFILLNGMENPLFNTKNLTPTLDNMNLLYKGDKISVQFSSDSKQIAMIDENGDYLDHYKIFLFLLLYTTKYKNLKGNILLGPDCPDEIRKMATLLGAGIETAPLEPGDFAYQFVQKNSLLGLNKPGEIFIHSHVPQPDGIWILLTILEFITKTGKTLHQIKEEVHSMTAGFIFENIK